MILKKLFIKRKIYASIIIWSVLLFIVAVPFAKAIPGYLGFVGINIPGMHRYILDGTVVEKRQYCDQWYYNGGTIDNLTGSRKNIDVQVVESGTSVTSIWTTIPDDTNLQVNSDNHARFVNKPGYYQIGFRRSDWSVMGASHSGHWSLD